MHTLLIAEKPSVGRDLATWLGKKFGVTPKPIGRTHIEVGAFNVSWLFGHILENVEPHGYDPKYKKWRMPDLPIIPQVWQLAPKADASAQISALTRLLSTATKVIGAGDPDQEGQLLQDEFLRWAGCRVPVDRLWLSALDDASIEKAWAGLKPNTHYEGYYWSALARSHADWLSGINLTRACTLAAQAQGSSSTLTIGRVQTPTLALVVNRELEIRHFKPVNHYVPVITLGTKPGFSADWSPDKEDARLDDEGRLLVKSLGDAIVSACLAQGTAVVSAVKAANGNENPPAPFALSSLQAHMSRRSGMSVADVLKVAQSLYEKKLTSYPRTDCEFLPSSQHGEAPAILKCLAIGIPGLGSAPEKANPALKSAAFDDKGVTAHHAIVPRPFKASDIAGLSSSEKAVWLEIAKRYLLQFFPAATFKTTELLLTSGGEPFRVKGKVYTSRGWKDAFSGDAADDAAIATLPLVKKGDVLPLAKAELSSLTTKPPKRYTEGTLLTAMKAVHRYVSDPKLKEILRENVGLGTEATRASIISELFKRGFLEHQKQEIKPSVLGETLITSLPPQLTKPDMTALWQQTMEGIRDTREAGYLKFMADQSTWLKALIGQVPDWFKGKALPSTPGSGGSKGAGGGVETAIDCPACKKAKLRHLTGKFGKFFACADKASCGATFDDVKGKPVAKPPKPAASGTVAGVASGSACPKCKTGTMQLKTCGPATKSPGKQFLSCSNYKAASPCSHTIWAT